MLTSLTEKVSLLLDADTYIENFFRSKIVRGGGAAFTASKQ